MLSCVEIKENVGYDMAANRRRYPEWMVGTLRLEQNMGYSFHVLTMNNSDIQNLECNTYERQICGS